MIALYIILGIIATFFLVSLLLPSAFTYEVETTINKSKTEVFNYFKYLKNQNDWSVWIMNATDMKQDFKGTDGTEGFIYAWEGKKSGK